MAVALHQEVGMWNLRVEGFERGRISAREVLVVSSGGVEKNIDLILCRRFTDNLVLRQVCRRKGNSPIRTQSSLEKEPSPLDRRGAKM